MRFNLSTWSELFRGRNPGDAQSALDSVSWKPPAEKDPNPWGPSRSHWTALRSEHRRNLYIRPSLPTVYGGTWYVVCSSKSTDAPKGG